MKEKREKRMADETELRGQILRIQSSCTLISWIITTMNEGAAPETTESMKYELTEGVSSLLEKVNEELDKIQDRLGYEK